MHKPRHLIATFAAALLACSLAVHAQDKPTAACKDAEALYSESQVFAVEAYASGDFDRAKAGVDKAKASLQKAREAATQCGCFKSIDPARKTADQLDDTMQTQHFNEVQERLYEVIGSGERARMAAEQCWRTAATEAKKQ